MRSCLPLRSNWRSLLKWSIVVLEQETPTRINPKLTTGLKPSTMGPFSTPSVNKEMSLFALTTKFTTVYRGQNSEELVEPTQCRLDGLKIRVPGYHCLIFTQNRISG